MPYILLTFAVIIHQMHYYLISRYLCHICHHSFILGHLLLPFVGYRVFYFEYCAFLWLMMMIWKVGITDNEQQKSRKTYTRGYKETNEDKSRLKT